MKAKILKRALVCFDIESGNTTMINCDIEVEVYANHVNGVPGIVFDDGKSYCTHLDHIEMIDDTFDFGEKEYHNLIVVEDVEPELSEPFENWDEMVSAAEQHREKDPEQKDGIYHLTVPKGVRIEIDTYCGARE